MRFVHAMKHRALFSPLIQSRSVQAAMMVLRPGQSSSDEKENEHPVAEQWLFVVKGSGKAVVGRRSVKLREGSLLLIEKGEAHRITNTGRAVLTTINFYAPPAYDQEGEVRSAVAGN